jgi:hypothetical protein
VDGRVVSSDVVRGEQKSISEFLKESLRDVFISRSALKG